MKVLVTGFEPFNGEKINPSYEILKKLPEYIDNKEILVALLPTTLEGSLQALRTIIRVQKPDAVINLGQAKGRCGISLERIGINVKDFSIPDNNGNIPKNEIIIKNGDDAYFTTIPNERIVEKLRENNIPAYISNSAGAYICNYVCYSMAYLQRNSMNSMKTGFIHVPALPLQCLDGKTPFMELEVMVKAVEIAIRAL